MLGSIDWTGISAVIAAIAGGIVSVIGALAALEVKRRTATANGHTLGQVAETVNTRTEAMATPAQNDAVPPPIV